MPLKWKTQGEWFNDRHDICTVRNGDFIKHHSRSGAFTLQAFYKDNITGNPNFDIENEIGNIVKDNEILYKNTAYPIDDFTPILNFRLDPDHSECNGYPVRISLYFRVESSGIEEGMFKCNFIRSFSGADYNITIEDLKLNGFHGLYIFNNNETLIQYIPANEWVHFEMVFPLCISNFNPSNASAYDIVPCEIKINGVSVATLDFPNIQMHDIEFQLFDAFLNGRVDIKNFTAERIVEMSNPSPVVVKILRENIGNKIRLSAVTDKTYHMEDTAYRKIVIISQTGLNNSLSEFTRLKFTRLLFEDCDTSWNPGTPYNDILNETVTFCDQNNNILSAKAYYVSSRAGNNVNANYDPHMFFDADSYYDCVRKYNNHTTASGKNGVAVNAYTVFKYCIEFNEPVNIEKIRRFHYYSENLNNENIIKIYKSDDGVNYSIEYIKYVTSNNSFVNVHITDSDRTDEDVEILEPEIPESEQAVKSYRIVADATLGNGSCTGLNNFSFDRMDYISCSDVFSPGTSDVMENHVVFNYNGNDIRATVKYLGSRCSDGGNELYDPSYLFAGCSPRNYTSGAGSADTFGVLAGSDNHLMLEITFDDFVPFNAIRKFKCQNYNDIDNCVTAETINFKFYESEDFENYTEIRDVDATLSDDYYTVSIKPYVSKNVEIILSNLSHGQYINFKNIDIDGLVSSGSEINDDGSVVKYYTNMFDEYDVRISIPDSNSWETIESDTFNEYYQYIESSNEIHIEFETSAEQTTISGKTLTMTNTENKDEYNLTVSVYADGQLISSEDVVFDSINITIP